MLSDSTLVHFLAECQPGPPVRVRLTDPAGTTLYESDIAQRTFPVILLGCLPPKEGYTPRLIRKGKDITPWERMPWLLPREVIQVIWVKQGTRLGSDNIEPLRIEGVVPFPAN